MTNVQQPTGKLDGIKKFLPWTDDLSACAVTPPLNMDKDVAIDMAEGLSTKHVRSYEMWWDGAKKELQIVLVAETQDMSRFQLNFRGMYPNATFSNLERIVPEWYDPAKTQYRIFDVGTRHGHYAAVYDTAKSHQLATHIANTMQLYRYVWIQFAFVGYDLTRPLDRHVRRLDARYRMINSGNYLSLSERLLYPSKKPHAHPELEGDYMNNYPGLQKHASMKRQGKHTLLSIRGLAQTDSDINLPFDRIKTPPAGNAGVVHDYLTTLEYGYPRFWSSARKSRVKLPGRKDASPRIRMFDLRLIPDPKRFLDDARSKYFNKNWLGKYRERRPLPFVILTGPEMPVFIHLPDPSVPNMDTTRGATLPSRPSKKTGASIGFLNAQDDPGGSDGYSVRQETEEPGDADP